MQLLVRDLFIAKTVNRLRSNDASWSRYAKALQTLSLQRVWGISAWTFINMTLERMQPLQDDGTENGQLKTLKHFHFKMQLYRQRMEK